MSSVWWRGSWEGPAEKQWLAISNHQILELCLVAAWYLQSCTISGLPCQVQCQSLSWSPCLLWFPFPLKTSVASLLGSPPCSVQLQEKQFAIFNHIIHSLKLVIIIIILPQIKPQRLQFVYFSKPSAKGWMLNQAETFIGTILLRVYQMAALLWCQWFTPETVTL